MTILKHNKPVTLKDSELWQFSLKFYANESNRNAFLFLQDNYNLNINMLLGLIWYAASGRGSCSFDEIQSLHNSISPWQTLITHELRNLRKHLSKSKDDIYQYALSTEIFSEKIQQCIIFDFFYSPKKHITNAAKKAKQGAINLQTYFSICKANLTEQGYQQVRLLLSNAFVAFQDYDFPQLSLEL